MIRTLVVDDDYHVAHAHALSVGRVPGFSVVAEAHSAEEARLLIKDEQPDLLLLDMYLPDYSGLDLIRRLTRESTGSTNPDARGHVPDFLLVTAARDIQSVRSAMQLGAIYFLVKPFTFAALREQLESYRQWRQRLEKSPVADQDLVDELYGLLRSPAVTSAARSNLPPTMARVLDVVQSSSTPVGAADVAQRLGVSRPTAQRYLALLVQKQAIDLDLAYGTTGRPEHLYLVRSPRR
ncbi:MAG: response regulator [Dermatophilaceae bacterium]